MINFCRLSFVFSLRTTTFDALRAVFYYYYYYYYSTHAHSATIIKLSVLLYSLYILLFTTYPLVRLCYCHLSALIAFMCLSTMQTKSAHSNFSLGKNCSIQRIQSKPNVINYAYFNFGCAAVDSIT